MDSHNLVIPAKTRAQRNLYTDEQERAITRRVALGETRAAVADDLNVHRNTVSNICDRHPEVFAEVSAQSKKDQA